jgi:hypothetical protein
MHILYFGDWLPHAWMKKVWKEVTGDSDNMDIRSTKFGISAERSLAGYILAQYTLFRDGDIRFQMSNGGAGRGMVRDWKRAVKRHTKCVNGQYKGEFHELLWCWSHLIKERKYA